MRKTPNATKAHAKMGYWKHLRPAGKRIAHKSVRKHVKQSLGQA